MSDQQSILLLHGVGDPRWDANWEAAWLAPLHSEVEAVGANMSLAVRAAPLSELFPTRPPSVRQIAKAMGRLLGSRAKAWFGECFPGWWDDFKHTMHDTAGMVVQWLANDALRAALRQRLAEEILTTKTTLILAHSLGSLFAYDLFTQPNLSDELRRHLRKVWLVTLGAQLNSPWLVGNFSAGRIVMPAVEQWWHLWNPADRVFTAPIRLPCEPRFGQIETEFSSPPLHHDAVRYLAHPAVKPLWRAWSQRGSATPTTPPRRARLISRWRPNCKALLVGIDAYPATLPSLQGCVNDCYLVSSALQDWMFAPENIRLITNERATTAALRQRIAWLLDDVGPGDVRVLYYAGHGAELTLASVDQQHSLAQQCLVPYDFDWTAERSIADDWLLSQYQQLPYATRLVLVLDCCHAGGVARGGHKVRGLDPPDDVRHRCIRWDSERELWVPRRKSMGRGRNLAPGQLGSAWTVRSLKGDDFRRRRAELGHQGPYQPLVISACGKSEVAEEYLHGSVSYGAMTFVLAKEIRNLNRQTDDETWPQLVSRVQRELRDTLVLRQTPQVTGPKAVLLEPLPKRRPRANEGGKLDGARRQNENDSATAKPNLPPSSS